VELFTKAGWRKRDVDRALDKLLEERDAVSLTLLFDADDPEAWESAPPPPIPGPPSKLTDGSLDPLLKPS